MGVMEGVTLGVALLGAVLGVINTCWAIWRDRVRLKVVPLWIRPAGTDNRGNTYRVNSQYQGSLEANPDGQFAIRVINRGLFEVTIESVGLTRSGWIERHWRRSKLARKALLGDGDGIVVFPKRLAPRESIVVVCSYFGAELDHALAGTERVYASTSCGVDAFGGSRLLRALAGEASRLR